MDEIIVKLDWAFEVLFSDFKDKYLDTFVNLDPNNQSEVLLIYQDNYGCEQFKAFYFIGLEICNHGTPFIHNMENMTLQDAYNKADFNIYDHVWYPFGITEDDMDEFDSLMKACLTVWEKWCHAIQYYAFVLEKTHREKVGVEITMSEKAHYNDIISKFDSLNISAPTPISPSK